MSPTTLSRPQTTAANVGLNRSTTSLPALVQNSPSRPAVAWRSTIWSAALFAGVLIAVVVAQPWKWWNASVAASEVHATAARVVNIARPSPSETNSVLLPANVRPWQSATLNARVTGYLKNWKVELGARVEAGELLAEIETPELDQELAQGIALAREADAAVHQAKAERREAEADLQAAEAEVGRAKAEAELSRTQLTRRQKLVANRDIQQEEYDTFAKQVETRAAEVNAAESELARRRANLLTRTAVIESREATARSREASVERLKELQNFKRIVAPFAGVITRRDAEVGMLVTPGKEALFTIEDMSRVRVQVDVPQAYSTQTRVGATTTVSLPESSNSTTAVVTRTADSVDPTTRTMLAEIELENGEGRWQPGSYVQVGIATAARESSWTIPTSALQMRVEGPHVAVVNERNEVEIRAVKLGRDLGSRVIVTSGIQGHERLVINPNDSLADGEKVEAHENAELAAKS